MDQNFLLINGFLIIVFLFILDLFLRTEYLIVKNRLIIKCGVFYKKEIDIDRIKSVEKTNSLLSSPAPSFDRIAIKYGKLNEVIISPKNKILFAGELIKINSKLNHYGLKVHRFLNLTKVSCM
ncbi:MAG: PH domain-containing protein [Flavobacteriaceae bacterium]|nr:PH domain-containing protein [Flavobacteriaceae bacterium]